MTLNNILIIGVTGCVGHYLFDELVKNPQNHLHLLIRPDAKIYFDPKQFPNVTVYPWRLKNLLSQQTLLMQMDFVVHLATPWGGDHIWQTNIGDVDKLFTILGESPRLKKIVYFSTASILGEDGKVTEAALKLGTGYVRSKYMMHMRLPRLKVFPKVITIFPTWVFGGDAKHPYSHASEGIPGILKNIGLIKRLRFEFRFHFMHAADIAKTVAMLMANPNSTGEYIVGQGAYSFNQLVSDAAQIKGQKIGFQFNLTFGFISALAKILRKTIAPWDRYCFERKNFIFNVTNPESLGAVSRYREFKAILSD
jgi:nucleoside-diphosphate-sugar epimerase